MGFSATSKITIRKFRRGELLDAFKLVIKSANHLRVKNGRKPWDLTIDEVPAINYHLFDTDPDGTFGAYSKGKLVGYTAALLRGRQWYLAYLFVDPEFQLKGVGRKLLEHAWKYAAGKINSRALCTFPYNEAALALYSSFGMMPTSPILEMVANFDGKNKAGPTKLRIEEDDSRNSIIRINGLERFIRGYCHLVDLEFFASDPKHKIYQFYRGREWVGYAVVGNNRLIAPAGATEPNYLPEIITGAYNRCLESKSDYCRIWIGGPNAIAYKRAIDLGFQISEMTAFLSTRPYGDFSRYCPAHLAIF